MIKRIVSVLVECVRCQEILQSLECIAVCSCYFTRAEGHLLNVSLSVNYKTHLDMQFTPVAIPCRDWSSLGQ